MGDDDEAPAHAPDATSDDAERPESRQCPVAQQAVLEAMD